MIPVIAGAAVKALPYVRTATTAALKSPATKKWCIQTASTFGIVAAADVALHGTFQVLKRGHKPHPRNDAEYLREVGSAFVRETKALCKYTAGTALYWTSVLGYIPSTIFLSAGMGLSLVVSAVAAVGEVIAFQYLNAFSPGTSLELVRSIYLWIVSKSFDVLTYPAKLTIRGQVWLAVRANRLRADWAITGWLAYRLEVRRQRLEQLGLDPNDSELVDDSEMDEQALVEARQAQEAVETQMAETGIHQLFNHPSGRRRGNPVPEGITLNADQMANTELAKQYGATLFLKVKELHGYDRTVQYRIRLPRDIRRLKVDEEIVQVVLKGYDEASASATPSVG